MVGNAPWRKWEEVPKRDGSLKSKLECVFSNGSGSIISGTGVALFMGQELKQLGTFYTMTKQKLVAVKFGGTFSSLGFD